jgi:hypothetical protein
MRGESVGGARGTAASGYPHAAAGSPGPAAADCECTVTVRRDRDIDKSEAPQSPGDAVDLALGYI